MTITLETPKRASPPLEKKRSKQRIVYVNRVQFCDLLISRKQLERSDSLDGQWRGLIDVTTGVRYLIDENKL